MSAASPPDRAIVLSKAELRGEAVAKRKALSAAQGEAAARQLAERFMGALATFGLRPGQPATIAGYWPIKSELNPRPLLERLQTLGLTIALPVAVRPGEALVFRRWSMSVEPPPGAHGVPAPPDRAATLAPDLVLAPLLAFDRKGWRLGSGLGYYDRTLAKLRGLAPTPIAVGIAFAGQEVQEVAHDAFDQRLDWVVTEREIIRASGA